MSSPLAWNVPSPWRPVIAPLLVLLLGLLVLYHETALAMVTIWERSGTFAHGFFVPPIAAWLIWRRREELAAVRPHPSAPFLVLFAGSCLIWLLGDLGAINSLTQLAFTALLVLTVPAVLGLAATRVMLFPLAFLFFAVPLGEFLVPRLMIWTADFTVLALQASGIPVYREGLLFVIPSGTWSVVETCSGVRYLIASLMIGSLFAYLQFRSLTRRLIFVAVSIGVPIIANWVRAYLIVLLGHVSNNELATGVDHLIYGWIFFGAVICLMFMIGIRFADADRVVAGSATPPPRGTGSARAGLAWGVATAGLVLAVSPHVLLRTWDAREGDRDVQLVAPATLAGGWQLSAVPVTDWQPAYQNPAAQMQSSYASGDRRVGLYIAYYRHQNFNHKLVNSDNVLVKSANPTWMEVTAGSQSVALESAPLRMRTAVLRPKIDARRSTDYRLRVWHTYWVDGHFTSSDHLAKAYGILGRLLGRGDDSAAVIMYVQTQTDEEARQALESFARANLGVIGTQLAAVRDRE